MTGCHALYIHIPFCRRKCGYCSFVSYPGRESDIHGYVDALRSEIHLRSNGEPLSSVYFGGGTPGLLGLCDVADILESVSRYYRIEESAEISLETNPGTIDPEYLSGLRSLGINRLSLGVQSFDDRELSMLGRIHTAAEARDAVNAARRAGFDNLNLDLIYGTPCQTRESWRRTLDEAVRLGPEHISLYALTLEPGCTLAQDIEHGRLPEPDSDLAADMYELAEGILGDTGYRHYEISNWARSGFECRHNLVYWRNLPYLGVGVAAHSSMNGKRTANTSDLNAYLAAKENGLISEPDFIEDISPDLRLAESVILGLRLEEGVDIVSLNAEFNTDIGERYRMQIEEMTDAGLLEREENTLRLTRRGRLLSNEVFWRMLPEEEKVPII